MNPTVAVLARRAWLRRACREIEKRLDSGSADPSAREPLVRALAEARRVLHDQDDYDPWREWR